MSQNYQAFSAIDEPFCTGITLIEASAGTGKTFSIAYLVLRLIVEQGLTIDEILTVTFTNAATEELKARIRAHLYQARKAYQVDSDDEGLMRWIQLRRIANTIEQDKERLNEALSKIDEAGIFTIHGFCQRVLTEFPLESQQAFKVEISQNLNVLKMQIVHDFWRMTVYPLTAQRARWLLAVIESPTALYDWLIGVGDHDVTLVPKPKNLDDLWGELDKQSGVLEQWLTQYGESARCWLVKRADNFSSTAQAWIDDWALKYAVFLSSEGFSAQLNGHKFRDTKAMSKAQKIQAFWGDFVAIANPPVIAASAFIGQQTLLESSVKQALLDYYHKAFKQRQDQQGVMGFNDLITRLANVLKSDGQHIQQAMQKRFKAALIDEFQDTDADQWRIFKAFFATEAHYLYLIGDPKQAIYKFRGADIETYLSAAHSANTKLTLATNWRSTPNLVKATNAIFEQNTQPFKIDGLAFHPVNPGKTDKDSKTVDPTPLVMWTWSDSQEDLSADQQKQLICNNVCQDMLTRLRDGQHQPHDFAVLVRSHAMAAHYQQTLMRLGIPAVIKSNESVFESDEAKALWRVMQAILQPTRLNLAKEALSESFFGLNAGALYQAIHEDNRVFEQWMLSLNVAHERWHQIGLLPALMGFLEGQRVFEHLNHFMDAERRITNLLHCLEWLQEKVMEEALTPTQTLHAFESVMTDKSAEASELRLESDEKAVQIVTIHASKGLQYQVVYCPDLYKSKDIMTTTKVYKLKEAGQWKISADQSGKEQLKEAYLRDLRAEDLRLVYVALTRAEARCVVVMPLPQPKKDESSLVWLLPHGVPNHPHIRTSDLQEINSLNHLYSSDAESLNADALQTFKRWIDTRYRLTSYSAISRGTLQEEEGSKAEAEVMREVDEQALDEQVVHVDDGIRLPKGAHFGNLLHDLLEYRHFSSLATNLDEAMLLSLCRRHGVREMIQLGKDEKIKPDYFTAFKALIEHTVTAEIDKGFALKHLKPNHLLKEMPFYLALGESNTTALNEAMKTEGADIPYQPLAYRDLVGHLNGFVDLIAEYNGRFYVMDYKSNDLKGDYSQQKMHQKMKQANYGLQGVIYTLALHRYLRSRIVNYNFDTHFGGVRYLFVRGMSANYAEQGIYRFKPSKALIEQLDTLFGGAKK